MTLPKKYEYEVVTGSGLEVSDKLNELGRYGYRATLIDAESIRPFGPRSSSSRRFVFIVMEREVAETGEGSNVDADAT